MASENDRWKKKYFDKLDEFEQVESGLKERIHVLERIVVRVSLAAEGVDKDLDRELEALRNILRRENGSSRELNQQLDSIEKKVLALDQHKQAISGGVLEALGELIEQLSQQNISREARKQLKKYGKQLKNRVEDLRHYPQLLKEFSQLQAAVLQELFSDSDGRKDKKEGFLSRLFANREGGESVVQEELEEDIEAPPPQSQDAEESRYALEVGQDAAASTLDGGNFEPGFSAIADHVCISLNHLIDQLVLPPNMLGDSEKLKNKISGGLNWYELAPTLDDVAALAIAAVGRGQREFESFLKALDERLASIQNFLQGSQANVQESRDNNAELEKSVREQVTSMQENVRGATDIDSLKCSVQHNLDTLISSIDRFMHKEADREARLSEEVELLHHRLRELESESGEVRERLEIERARALTDALTALPNREAYENRVRDEFERWRRYGNPLTLVVADIDRFKEVNDKFGHLAGDKVIQLIGKEVSRRIRKTDFIARYGGEEFVVLLPETPASIAAEVMDKTREMISRLPFHFRNEKVRITMSFGVCEFHGDATVQGVFEKADQALYKAKRSGRNQVQIAGV
ncbi:Response regulator containing a CheY-like receiver domain and a GGDEF domain [Hahella chejuensis KCTC 2396]|uniref:diguanylate cyclase n=1 Tax=Hahella chejuensis (strain KCTC 2396) TaxID=349521 RepID=Q2SQ60_HAHCH|nr:GGDEF domain-containing protein [Hahella chejuensis]ABC27214.1 Response regulator containing a CheY-like receiver domain and a GGDEF domain [Hahella chejuensis KCTC 2396]